MSVFDLSGRKALVTGGAQGLGEGMAQALAAAGATVVIADLQDEAGRTVAEVARRRTTGSSHLDVTDEASWEAGDRRDRRSSSAASTSWSTTPASRSPA